MKITRRQLRRTIRRVIRESNLGNTYKDPNESIREAEEALLQFGEWEISEQEILDWWMNEGDHLIEFLPDVDWENLPAPCVRAMNIVMEEMGLSEPDSDSDDGYWGSEASHYDEYGELLPDYRDDDNWA